MRLGADRTEQVRTGLLATPASLRADAAVLVMLCVPLALLSSAAIQAYFMGAHG